MNQNNTEDYNIIKRQKKNMEQLIPCEEKSGDNYTEFGEGKQGVMDDRHSG